MSNEGRFRHVGPVTERVARGMGVEAHDEDTPEEAAERRRCMDRMIDLRDRHPWLRGRHAFIQGAALWLSFRVEKIKRTVAGWIRRQRGEG